MVLRIDKSSINEHLLDQNGYLDVDAYATRAGVFIYRQPDGTVTRELRHPDEVFKTDSLDTLKSRPVCNDHPKSGLLDAKNTKYLTIGWNKETVERADDDHVKVSLIIHDENAISKVTNGEKVELSCGYHCDTYPEEGEYNGEKYDHVQKNIKYNHIALVEKGRAGSKARIYLDADDAVIDDDDFEPTTITKEDRNQEKPTMTIKIKRDAIKTGRFNLDAATIEVNEDSENSVNVLTTHLDSAVEIIRTLESEVDKLQGRNDELQEQAAQAVSPERLDSLARERADLCGVAGYLGLEDFAKLENADIKKAIVQKANGNIKLDDKSDDYIDGRYESVVDRIKQDHKGLESLANLKKVVSKKPGKDDTHLDKKKEVEPREKLKNDSKGMWKEGLVA